MSMILFCRKKQLKLLRRIEDSQESEMANELTRHDVLAEEKQQPLFS